MSNALFSRTDKSFLGRWWWTVDRMLLAALMTLIVFGIVLVAAASPPVAERIGYGQFHFVTKHLFFLLPAFIMLIGMSFLEPRNIWRFATLMLVGGIGAMVMVLLFGDDTKGAQRWLRIAGFSLQPSEFVKPAFAVVAAWLIARQKDADGFPGQSIALGLFALVTALLLMQPDFGMTVVVTAIYGAQIFLAGLPLFWLIVFCGGAVVLAVSSYFALDHVRSRFDRFFDPASGDTYQVRQSLEAFKEGGVTGAGPGQGTVKLHLPDAHTDFIFSVAGEELGLVFAVMLVFLYGFIVLRGMNRVAGSNDIFVILATGGLLVMFGFQAFIHMASSVNLIPTKGMTLPFVSYGGSSIIAMGAAMGMVLSLTRQRVKGGQSAPKKAAAKRQKGKAAI